MPPGRPKGSKNKPKDPESLAEKREAKAEKKQWVKYPTTNYEYTPLADTSLGN